MLCFACPSKNDMVSTSLSTSGSMDATETTGAQVAKKEVNTSAYGDWMVVARKKKTHVNSRSREDQGRQLIASQTGDQIEIPQETHSDSRKDMKRKATRVAMSTDKRKDDASKKGSNFRQSNPSTHSQMKGKKGFSYKEPSRPVKVNNRNSKDRIGFSPTVSGWEAKKWPSKPLTTINTNPNFCFPAGSDELESSKEPMSNIPEGENNTSRDVNNYRDTERSNRYHGMVWRRRHDGLEEHFSLDRGECSARILAGEGQSLDEHPQSLLALPDGSAKISTSAISATRDSLWTAPLRKITNSLGGSSPGATDLIEKGTPMGSPLRWPAWGIYSE